MGTKQPAEQRKHLRFPSNRPVLMIMDNKSIYATMTDFSRHGIGFITTETPNLHGRVEVHFDIPSSNDHPEILAFQFKAEIKHCISTYNNESHIGVRIELPSEEYLKAIETLYAA